VPTLEIPGRFNRSTTALRDPAAAEESALFLIQHVCRTLGVANLSDHEVLDVGCGTKFTQALINHGLPIKRYVGVDLYAEMIDFLRENVADARFEYHDIDVRNEAYNPDAPPMTVETDLGVGASSFDLIWLFSVFTHMGPPDYHTMLRLLRRYVRPNGRLIYTLFIDELTDGGYGYIDQMQRVLSATGTDGSDDRSATEWIRDVKPFVDVDPEHPLRWALYSREYAYELIEGTGWTPMALLPPNEFAQHHFICAPA
jgi:SAM-dependent methyltransferase